MIESAAREHLQLLLQVARWYYLDQESQDEIARRISFSRSSVSRMLTEARRRGVVRFMIGHPLERQVALEKALMSRFGLRAVRVADAEAGPTPLVAVAAAGAEVLAESCREATVLAASAGSTVSAVVEQLPFLALRDLHVVQMIGMLERSNPMVDSPEVTRRIAERLGGDYRQLPAPLIVATPRLAQALRHEDLVANALALASHADVAILGIGAMTEGGTSGQIFRGWLTAEESEVLVRQGAVGHLCGQHFDAHGRQIVSELRDRVIAVPLDRLQGVKTVIGVAVGAEKVAAIRGAVLGRYLDVLVTDTATAQAVLRVDVQSGPGVGSKVRGG